MRDIDKRGALGQEPFSFKITKDGKVLIAWNGKHVMILKGKEAGKFISKITAADPAQAQLLMARTTGHFKHGNER